MNDEQLELLKSATINIPEFSLKNKKILCNVVDVYDGDTVKVVFFTNNILHRWTVRLKGINTPEMRPSLKLEGREMVIENAKKSRDFLKSLFKQSNNLVYILCDIFGKYGRLIGTFFINEHESTFEESINNNMIISGYAQQYKK